MRSSIPSRLALIATVCGLAAGALAQESIRPSRPVVTPGGNSGTPTAVQEANAVKFDSLVQLDANGKVIPLEGVIDICSLHRNPTIDNATWQKVTPVLVEWMSDVDRSVIDNLDFVEALDGGVLENTDVMDMNNNRKIMEMMMQFLSIGPATTTMEQRGALSRTQALVNTNIGNDYLQKMLDQTRQEAQARAESLPDDQKEAHVVNSTSKFIFTLMWRDAQQSYARQLDEAAPNLDKLINSLTLAPEVATQAKDAARKVKAASAGESRRRAMKETLALIPFDKRRELLTKARDLAPPFNPRTAYVPPPADKTELGSANERPAVPSAGVTDAPKRGG